MFSTPLQEKESGSGVEKMSRHSPKRFFNQAIWLNELYSNLAIGLVYLVQSFNSDNGTYWKEGIRNSKEEWQWQENGKYHNKEEKRLRRYSTTLTPNIQTFLRLSFASAIPLSISASSLSLVAKQPVFHCLANFPPLIDNYF